MRINSILELPSGLQQQAAARLASLPVTPTLPAVRRNPDAPKIAFEAQCAAHGIVLQREVRFHPTRRWRVDYVVAGSVPSVAIEYEGGVRETDRQKSGHLSYSGYKKDIEKYNALAAAGYRLIRIYAEAVRTGAALAWVREALK